MSLSFDQCGLLGKCSRTDKPEDKHRSLLCDAISEACAVAGNRSQSNIQQHFDTLWPILEVLPDDVDYEYYINFMLTWKEQFDVKVRLDWCRYYYHEFLRSSGIKPVCLPPQSEDALGKLVRERVVAKLYE